MHDSLWRSSFRALLVTFFAVIGIFLAFLPLVWLINSSETEATVTANFSVDIIPNAEGVRKKQSKSAPVILQIDVQGVIGTDDLNEKTIRALLVESREDPLDNDRVKGILLNINSPGGGMTDADGIYRALLAYKARYRTPIYAFVDGLCASGGVYVSCAADEIYATDASLVGSVGVITSSFVNVSKLLEKIGVDSLTIYAGKGKDDLNPMRPWKPDEDKNYRDIINYYYMSFVDLVTKHRPKISKNILVDELGANIFPAEKAVKIGFIDGMGESRESTLKKLLAKLGIEDDYYQVVSLSSTNWLKQLFKEESPIFSGKIKHEVVISGELPERLQNQLLYLYQPN